MNIITATRWHDISCGHRVYGHESKCAHLHGHNYRIHFVCEAPQLDGVGRVIDFSEIKDKLCMWVEQEWDHRFLIWQEDELANNLPLLDDKVVVLPFNPTAENMARFLVEVIGPQQLVDSSVSLVKVMVEETARCSASYTTIAVAVERLKEEFRRNIQEGIHRGIINVRD